MNYAAKVCFPLEPLNRWGFHNQKCVVDDDERDWQPNTARIHLPDTAEEVEEPPDNHIEPKETQHVVVVVAAVVVVAVVAAEL